MGRCLVARAFMPVRVGWMSGRNDDQRPETMFCRGLGSRAIHSHTMIPSSHLPRPSLIHIALHCKWTMNEMPMKLTMGMATWARRACRIDFTHRIDPSRSPSPLQTNLHAKSMFCWDDGERAIDWQTQNPYSGAHPRSPHPSLTEIDQHCILMKSQ